MARALIFGVNGFVGPWLARELTAHGWEVCGSDRADAPKTDLGIVAYRQTDLLDSNRVATVVAELHPALIVNLAAVSSVGASWKAPQATVKVNVVGAMNVLEAVRALDGCQVLLVGSSEEYAPSEGPLSEGSPVLANNPYGISKASQGRFADLYHEHYGMRVNRVRAFNHTGPGQRPTFVLPSWCRQVADIEYSGRPGTMQVGNLDVRRDFSDVRDVVRAYRLIAESNCAGEVFNVGSGVAQPLSELLDTIRSFSSQEIGVETDPTLMRPSDNPVILCDCGKAKRLLGWRPERNLTNTLWEMYEGFLEVAE